MTKRFFLLAAMLGLMVLGMASAGGQEQPPPTDWGTCKWYCGSTPYNTQAQCAAACGGPAACDKIC